MKFLNLLANVQSMLKKTEFLEKSTFYVVSSLIYFVFSKDQKHLKVNVTTLTTERETFGL